MSDSRLFNKTYDVISNSLDISARRHNLITGNVANMDTIGYKPKDIDFQKTLERAMNPSAPVQEIEMTHDKHFTGIDPEYLNRMNMNGRNSEDVDIHHLDSVNIDTEMANIVENNIKYRSTTEMLLRKMTILRHAIQEGGR